MKVVTIVGARPQFIKAAAVSRALRAADGVSEVLVHTGQHYDEKMSDVFFSELEIPRADHQLGVGSGSHGAQTGRMLEAIEGVLSRELPQWVLVYGDTNSTLAGALAASKLHIRVAHVEAGLRSFNRRMPEEINRVLTDHASDLLFAPTETAVGHLRSEGIAREKIDLSGDVMFDVALYFGEKAERESSILRRLGLLPGHYALATVHRAENTDDPRRLSILLEALNLVSRDLPVIFPVHPRTRSRLIGVGGSKAGRIRFSEPVGYLDMLMLEKNAAVIATDSGGVQKEAFFCSVPCVTLRDETEWTELVETGWNRLAAPTAPDQVADQIRAALGTQGSSGSPYGRGDAAPRIVARLTDRRACA